MLERIVRRTALAFIFCGLLAGYAVAQAVAPFSATGLVKLGDNVKYGSYVVYKIGEGSYKINDPGTTNGRGGAWGVDMYLIRGTAKAMIIDLGNNYVDGYDKDLIPPRKNAAEELRAIVSGLAGKLPLEIAITHAHPDHEGMTGTFLKTPKATFWAGQGEDPEALKTQFKLETNPYKYFPHGQKTFDLGGGHVVKTYLVRGHSNGGAVYLDTKTLLMYTGDALGSGFGQAFQNVEKLKEVAADSQKLVEAINAEYKPYERYAIRVYTGHTWQNPYGAYMAPNHAKTDIGFLDWRFVQDVAMCSNGILKGKWLEEGSGLHYVTKMVATESWPNAAGLAIFVYGTGTIITRPETAYAAAGLKMP